MDIMDFSGKTVEDAILEALKSLKVTRDDVEIKIIEQGSKGLLGFGAKPAKISATKKFNPEMRATSFLREVAASMGIDIEVSTTLTEKHLDIVLVGKEMGVLIGKRGQTLDSLQYLCNLVVNKGDSTYISVSLDSENYRQRRKETLESLAFNLAKKVKSTNKSVVLEPMTPNERRIIHSALQNDRFVSTHSEGDDPFRNVVISPKSVEKKTYGGGKDPYTPGGFAKKKEYSKPLSAKSNYSNNKTSAYKKESNSNIDSNSKAESNSNIESE